MKQIIKYSSIGQFRQIMKTVAHKTRFIGLDENNKPQYDTLKPLPILEAIGSEKIHGTNGAVGFSNSLGFWVQSKKQILTLNQDNNGCAEMVYKHQKDWENIVKDLAKENSIDLNKNLIVLYFELAGASIQKKSACSGLSKRCIIFQNFRVMDINELKKEENRESSWYPTKAKNNWVDNPEKMIFNIMNFPNYKIKIDFNNPEISHNQMIDLMMKVEKESPVGKIMGQEGNIGEGLVFELIYKGERLAWKVKGEKHSNSRIKKMKLIDLEKLAKIDRLVEEITHNWRFEQGLTEVFGSNYEKEISREQLGPYLKWTAKDTLKEEIDLIEESGLDKKEVMKRVQKKAREYFFKVEQEKENS